jgi:hypothetical protein
VSQPVSLTLADLHQDRFVQPELLLGHHILTLAEVHASCHTRGGTNRATWGSGEVAHLEEEVLPIVNEMFLSNIILEFLGLLLLFDLLDNFSVEIFIC